MLDEFINSIQKEKNSEACEGMESTSSTEDLPEMSFNQSSKVPEGVRAGPI